MDQPAFWYNQIKATNRSSRIQVLWGLDHEGLDWPEYWGTRDQFEVAIRNNDRVFLTDTTESTGVATFVVDRTPYPFWYCVEQDRFLLIEQQMLAQKWQPNLEHMIHLIENVSPLQIDDLPVQTQDGRFCHYDGHWIDLRKGSQHWMDQLRSSDRKAIFKGIVSLHQQVDDVRFDWIPDSLTLSYIIQKHCDHSPYDRKSVEFRVRTVADLCIQKWRDNPDQVCISSFWHSWHPKPILLGLGFGLWEDAQKTIFHDLAFLKLRPLKGISFLSIMRLIEHVAAQGGQIYNFGSPLLNQDIDPSQSGAFGYLRKFCRGSQRSLITNLSVWGAPYYDFPNQRWIL